MSNALYSHRNALTFPKLFDMVVVYDDEGKPAMDAAGVL